MRILLAYDHLDVGGAQTHGLGLSQALIQAGHEAAVASRGGSAAPRFAQIGVRCLDWPAPRRTDIAGLFRGIRRAERLLQSWRPDIIHAHAVLPGLMFSFAARRRIPVVFTPHRSWRSLYHIPGGRALNRLMVQMLRLRADAVIAVSEGLYRELTQQGIPSGRCHLIPNGVDVSTFDAIPPPPLSPNGSPRIVGTVGRLIEQKGVDVFIDAAALVVTHAPDVEFWIAGDGPLRETCRRRIAAHGMNGRMSLLGERADIPALLRHMSVFVSASHWEGMPYALLEALAAQRPVVATRVFGSSELIED
ncbi:MAG TPA: glycosyltransferase, partial [Anaerolineae bacterium]